jgi:molecular chaperone HtpG
MTAKAQISVTDVGPRAARRISREEVIVGRDVIELLSSGMYTDPLTIYREYIQNAADAVDRARAEGLLRANEGEVTVRIDAAARAVTITDDGIGIPKKDFVRRLASLGASSKRGLGERGFRGVGRLSGLAYAQELIFRTRTGGKSVVEMRWDCRRLRALMRVAEGPADVAALMAEVVSVAEVPTDRPSLRFFEVELVGVARLRGDRLMNPGLIRQYLSQVAPLPFDEGFSHGAEIQAVLAAAGVRLGNIRLTVNGGPVFRPHLDTFEMSPGRLAKHEEVEFFEITGTDDRLAAVGWLLHHPYEGALPTETLIKGLRVRVGNIQIGEANLLDELFAEPRFNSWTIGEVHVVDARIVPNGRRDGFEQDAHFANFANRLAPLARSIGRRCRISSTQRKLLRDAEATLDNAELAVAKLEQNAVGEAAWISLATVASKALARAERFALENGIIVGRRDQVMRRVSSLKKRMTRLHDLPAQTEPLALVPVAQRRAYEHMIELIYDCSTDEAAATALVDRILKRLRRTTAR